MRLTIPPLRARGLAAVLARTVPAILALIAVAPTPVLASAAPACPVIDLESQVEQLARDTANLPQVDQVAAYRRLIVTPHAGLYTPQVLGPMTPQAMDRALARSLSQVRAEPDRPARLAELKADLIQVEAAYAAAFPDFRCDFPIYLTDTLGWMDGAGRVVDGRPALVLGLDQISQEGGGIGLRVLLTHEIFHRYHSQAAGFSDDPGDRQAIWRTLWAEGLATYMSWRLTPGATADQALLFPPDLAERAGPHIAQITTDLLAAFDHPDPATYRTYFTTSPQPLPGGLPFRAGYYAGLRAAGILARHRSLDSLAHMRGPTLKAALRRALGRLASG